MRRFQHVLVETLDACLRRYDELISNIGGILLTFMSQKNITIL